MKKKDIISLIKYHQNSDNEGFIRVANDIANDFNNDEDYMLSEYIISLLTDVNTFVPQQIMKDNLDENIFIEIKPNDNSLSLPDPIMEDVLGIVNALQRNMGIHKFLFQGEPGTGKTETVKQIGRILTKKIYLIDFNNLIDSKLGQTSKNISKMFRIINELRNPEEIIILFDEIDKIALDRTNNHDIREMGRATSAFLQGMDDLNNKIIVIATTNLYKEFDQALLRRFDFALNFDRYTKQDLIEVADSILNELINKYSNIGRNIKLFNKILNLVEALPKPGDLRNIISTSIAFSKVDEQYDYLRKIYNILIPNKTNDIKFMKDNNFTLREIEILTKISKSQLSIKIKENAYE
ncbi:MAG: ATP-binding protein [Erysipelotrichaceae bacterium]